MKKLIYFMSLCLMSIILCSCGSSNELENFSRVSSDGYASIILDDKTYVPFCAVDNKYRGRQIGIVDNDDCDQVYEYKGYSSENWIISFYKSGEMDSSMLMREINVMDIPDNLESEYEWNNKEEAEH